MFKYTSSLYYFNQRSTFEAHFVKLHNWNLLPLLNGGEGEGRWKLPKIVSLGGGGGGLQNFLLEMGDKPEQVEWN